MFIVLYVFVNKTLHVSGLHSSNPCCSRLAVCVHTCVRACMCVGGYI